MTIRPCSSVLALAVTIALAAPSTQAGSSERNHGFRASGAGWAYASYAAGGAVGEAKGNSSLGIFESNVSVAILPPAGDCTLISGEPGIAFPVAGRSSITRFGNGDLLYSHSGENPGASFCVSFDQQRYSLVIEEQIIGGTGRFEGATGQWMVSVEGVSLSPVHSSIDALEIDGTVVLPTGRP